MPELLVLFFIGFGIIAFGVAIVINIIVSNAGARGRRSGASQWTTNHQINRRNSYSNPYGYELSEEERENLWTLGVDPDEVGLHYDRDGTPYGAIDAEFEDWDF